MKQLKGILAGLAAAVVTAFIVLIVFIILCGEDPSDSFLVCLLIAIILIPAVVGAAIYKKVSGAEGFISALNRRHPADFYFREKLQLVGGLLSLPEGSICNVAYNLDEIVFSAGGQEFTLAAEKLLDVSVMKPTEIQKQYVSSIGRAAAGAILLGPLGAAIGGTTRKKTLEWKRKLLVISYKSEGEVKYIVFDVTAKPGIGQHMQFTYRFLKKAPREKVDL